MLIRNLDFPLKNVDFLIKPGVEKAIRLTKKVGAVHKRSKKEQKEADRVLGAQVTSNGKFV